MNSNKFLLMLILASGFSFPAQAKPKSQFGCAVSGVSNDLRQIQHQLEDMQMGALSLKSSPAMLSIKYDGTYEVALNRSIAECSVRYKWNETDRANVKNFVRLSSLRDSFGRKAIQLGADIEPLRSLIEEDPQYQQMIKASTGPTKSLKSTVMIALRRSIGDATNQSPRYVAASGYLVLANEVQLIGNSFEQGVVHKITF
jgi:hypothetical protein